MKNTLTMPSARVAVDALIASLFAPVCVSCHQVLDVPTWSPACEVCWRNLRTFTPPLCMRCGTPMAAEGRVHACQANARALGRLRTLGSYEGVLRDLIHAVKYDRRRSLVVELAPLLARNAEDLISSGSLLVPVPLHPWRQWLRGFNQADDIAQSLARQQRGVQVVRALRRTRQTRPQSELDAERRQTNVEGAFVLAGRTSASRRRWERRLVGRHVVLVDDVMTTGATLKACGRVLLDAGVSDVSAVTLARVVLREK